MTLKLTFSRNYFNSQHCSSLTGVIGTANGKKSTCNKDRCRHGAARAYLDLWGYAVELLMPDRSKVRDQTKRHTGVYAVR